MTGFRVSVSPKIEAFAGLWPSLARPGAGAHTVFQTGEMLGLWRQTIGAARKALPLFVRIDNDVGEPLMLLALGVERRRGGARILVALDGGVCDYNAPVLFPRARHLSVSDAPRLWRALAEALPTFDAAVLEKMPPQVGGVGNPLCALAGEPTPPSGHFVPIDRGWDAFVRERLHRPKDSRRKLRRLAEAGPVRFVIAESSAERERLFAALLTHKKRRYLELNGADGFDRPGYRSYFRAATERFHPTGLVHISALEVAGEVLAVHWGLAARDRFYCLMLAFADHPLARYSPGRLLVEHLIRWSCEKGLRTFDLGYGDAPWKALVGAEKLPLFHACFPVTPFGWTYLEARKLRDVLKNPPLGRIPEKAA